MKRSITAEVVLAAILTVGACTRKAALVPVPAPAPTASLSANPNTVEGGQSTTLTGQTTNATDVSIDGVAEVDGVGPEGLSASDARGFEDLSSERPGAGGTREANARVTVTAAPPTSSATSPA
jgi:peptidoglycan-associated lipoprotein